jgi:transposase-like protein
MNTPNLSNDKYTLSTKTKAYELYLSSRMKNAEIADELGVKLETLACWIKEGKWRERKDEIEAEALEATDEHFRQFVRSHRMATLRRHFKTTEALERHIYKKLTAESVTGRPMDIATGDLLKLAKALKDSADVSARAAGITDRTFDTIPGLPSGCSQVILVGLQPKPVAAVSASAKNITSEIEYVEADPF